MFACKCVICNLVLSLPPSRAKKFRTCSKACHTLLKSGGVGPQHRTCQHCGKAEIVKPSFAARRYCSAACYHASRVAAAQKDAAQKKARQLAMLREKYRTDSAYREKVLMAQKTTRAKRYASDPAYRESLKQKYREQYAQNPRYRERMVQKRRERLADDQEYRERDRVYSRVRKREKYRTDPEYREREKQRSLKALNTKYRTDPEYRALTIRRVLNSKRKARAVVALTRLALDIAKLKEIAACLTQP